MRFGLDLPDTIQFYSAKFSFYGFVIQVKCQDMQTLQKIQRDYSFFLNQEAFPEVFFEVFNYAPDYSKLPCVTAHLYTPRNICYKQEGVSFLDYFGKGLMIINQDRDVYQVFCADEHLRHEIVFLSIMSLVGENLDSRNIHRVHGLGLAVNNQGVLILLPSGGGKTTFLLDIIKNQSVRLLSEDSPLIDASGRMLAFPLRIGVSHENKPRDIPEGQMHLINRMEFGSKYVIDVDFFKDKIAKEPVVLRHILCGVRCLGNQSGIKKISKYYAFKQLVQNSVVGLGLYQGVEFLFQRGLWEALKKSGVILSRLKNSCKILSQASSYSFIIGPDRSKNVKEFMDFCRAHAERV